MLSLLRRITREGIRARRLPVLVDSRVVFRSRLQRTIELTKNQFLAPDNLELWCLANDIALELVWVPTWANPADATFTELADRRLACITAEAPDFPPTAVIASVHALAEMDFVP